MSQENKIASAKVEITMTNGAKYSTEMVVFNGEFKTDRGAEEMAPFRGMRQFIGSTEIDVELHLIGRTGRVDRTAPEAQP